MPEVGDTVGKLTITLTHNGTGRPTPNVEFDPVGLFTPGYFVELNNVVLNALTAAQAAARTSTRIGRRI